MESEANAYGERKTAVTMMVHVARRMLQMGNAVGEMVPASRRVRVAGYKRSQSMARAYTNRAFDGMRRDFIVGLLPKLSRGWETRENEKGTHVLRR